MISNLILNCPLNQTSYGYCSTYFFLELLRNEIDVKYFPIGPVQIETGYFNELSPHFNQEGLVPAKTNCLKIWHQHGLDSFIGNGKHIGFPIFELDTFTNREKSHIASCDKLIVCSEWAKSVVNDQVPGVDVDVVPLGFNPEIFYPSKSSNGPFVFANFGKWEIRKGHDVLLQAFNSAFEENDDVELWMFPFNQHLDQFKEKAWVNYYKQSKLGDKIKIFPRMQTQEDLAAYMSQIDCAVFPARAEGWNLEALECLACGKEVIATNYSGHTEFLNTSCAHLIDLEGRETAYDGVFFHGQGKWASWSKENIDSLIERMRHVYNNCKMNDAGIEQAKNYTWEVSGKKLVKVLSSYEC